MTPPKKAKGKDGEYPKRITLRGYGQIRAFFREMGFSPPPHEATLYKWARNHKCPIMKAMGGKRVVADAKELASWIRREYFGRRVGPKPPEEDPEADDGTGGTP